MSCTPPKVVLRIGSHAEKAYFQVLAAQLDGIMFGGNLLEITPTATASLLVWLRTKRKGAIPFYLDPMTYCYGTYIDPMTGKPRSDLHSLKSTRIKDRKKKEYFTAVKDSYTKLAKRMGAVFTSAVNDGETCKAVEPWAFPSKERAAMCKAVTDYQLNRIDRIIEEEIPEEDEVMRGQFAELGKPAAIFAPYFFIHEKWADEGIRTAIDLVQRSVALKLPVPLHAVVCASKALLADEARMGVLADGLRKSGAAGAWLWFDGFDEHDPTLNQLIGFRRLVRSLAEKMEVYNLHGGYFSLLLAHDGLAGICNGVGYGEKKPVSQVIGAAAPTVRYYLPPISKRVGVPDIQRCLADLGIETAEEFYRQVCGCQICKGVIGDDLRKFATFGEMHRTSAEAQRDSQTPTAAKICRLHFLVNRLTERTTVAALEAAGRSQHVTDKAGSWRGLIALEQHLDKGYLEMWADALK